MFGVSMNNLINQIRQIAKLYGVKLIVLNNKNCSIYQKNGVIELGISGKKTTQVIRDFSNLMAAVICHSEEKFIYYYDQKYFKKFLQDFKTREQIAKYCVKAEIYTQKIAIHFMKLWFPERKYKKITEFKGREFYMGYFEGMWDC